MKALDSEAITDLAVREDPLGILSIFVDVDPVQQSTVRPAWRIELDTALGGLVDAAREEGPRERWAALSSKLDTIGSTIDRLADTSRSGRGRALFVALSDDWTDELAIRLPLPTRAVLGRNPVVRPLLAAADAGAPAGIVTLSRDGFRVMESRMGEAGERAWHAFDPDLEDREKRGPAAANPIRGMESASQRDRFESTVQDRLARFFAERAGGLAETCSERAWRTIVVAGDPRLTRPFAERMEGVVGASVRTAQLDVDGLALPPSGVAARFAGELSAAVDERRMAAVGAALEAMATGGPGAAGLQDVIAALNEGRVATLLVDQERAQAGYRLGEGMLALEGDPAAAGGEPEPHLVDAMILRALTTGADVLPLDGAAAERLAPHEGVAAQLRW